MAGRSTPTGSSPELHIKVQPRPPQPLTKKRFPWLVPTIVIANVFLFFTAMSINDCPRHSHKCLGDKLLGRFAFQPTHENPLLGPSANTLRKMGALDVNEVVHKHEVWRLVTCMWLHAGVVHILANMLSLVLVGIRFEQEFGFVRLGLLFVLSGIGGSLLSSLFVRTTISVGASGALFGLLGGMLSDLLINWTIYANKFATLSTLLIIIMFNLAMGILPHVDNFAHLGGFVSGFFLGFVLLIQPHYGWVNQSNAPPGYIGASTKSKYKTYQYALLIISLILLISAYTVGLIFLLRGVNGNDYCSWCHYLICVPTSLWSCDARCRSNQLGNQLNLTCLGNGKSKFYLLPNGNDTSEMQHLCYQLCS